MLDDPQRIGFHIGWQLGPLGAPVEQPGAGEAADAAPNDRNAPALDAAHSCQRYPGKRQAARGLDARRVVVQMRLLMPSEQKP